MSERVSSSEIEAIVGVQRHPTAHYGRAVSSEQRFYILHSLECVAAFEDLRGCPFSLALDCGLDRAHWLTRQDRAVSLSIVEGALLVESGSST